MIVSHLRYPMPAGCMMHIKTSISKEVRELVFQRTCFPPFLRSPRWASVLEIIPHVPNQAPHILESYSSPLNPSFPSHHNRSSKGIKCQTGSGRMKMPLSCMPLKTPRVYIYYFAKQCARRQERQTSCLGLNLSYIQHEDHTSRGSSRKS